jgi:hypothetical protein
VTRKKVAVTSVVAAIVVAGWSLANPGGRFGISRFGVTTYARIPVPALDLQVRADGALRVMGKTHEVNTQRIAWLLQPTPEVVIVALGWRGSARTVGLLKVSPGTRVIEVPTGEALALFNTLKDRGVRVAIHVHSTC